MNIRKEIEEMSWKSWINKLADYTIELADTYSPFSGTIKATCSLGHNSDIYHIKFERQQPFKEKTIVNDIYLNNDEMKVIIDFAERLSDKKLFTKSEVDKIRLEERKKTLEEVIKLKQTFDNYNPEDEYGRVVIDNGICVDDVEDMLYKLKSK